MATKKKATKKKSGVRKAAPAKKKAAPKKAAAKKKPAKKVAKKKAAPKKKSAGKPRGGIAMLVTPSEQLATIVGNKPLTRADLTKKIWAHIRSKGLQDSQNRRMINADDKLKPIFGGKSQVSMFDMTKFVNKHVQ